MSALLSTRDALAKALCDGLCHHEGRYLECEAKADRVLASGAVIDAATLADDQALVEAVAADQKEAADSWGEPLPGAERSLRARTALRALAAALKERAS